MDYLSLYLDAIDVETLKEKDIEKVKVHQGYRKTLERYLENENTLTLKELFYILSLYNIDDIPAKEELPIILLPELFIPQLRHFLSIPNFNLFIPQLRHELFIPETISYIPQLRHLLSLPDVISYIPQLRHLLIIEEEEIVLFIPQLRHSIVIQEEEIVTFIPQLRHSIETVGTNISFIPQPRHRTIPEQQESNITFIPQPRHRTFDEQVPDPTQVYLWGYTGYMNTVSRAQELSTILGLGASSYFDQALIGDNKQTDGFAQINDVDNPKEYMCTQWTDSIPRDRNAFVYFLIPAENTPVNSYRFGSGTSQIPGEIFPEPEGTYITYNGKEYLFTLSKIKTKLNGTTFLTV